ncbi:MAG TPA: molybdenum cofactor biosynthesis protein MoaE [Polyangia bacterium]|nr:molybdenum cofactor biosynthesis protein MoaE [Polyangia bacterium]
MRIQILYFAVLRERLGREQEAIELPANATVADALAALAGRHTGIAALLPRVQTAVNRAFADSAAPLHDGDELALIPPVAGGGAPGRRVAIKATTLDLADVIRAVEGPDRGGIVTFTGAVRRHGQRTDVIRLEYEAYAEMAEQVLTDIADEIEREWPGAHVAIHHRVGALSVGEMAVVIAVAAAHRAEAFDACRAAIDRLKRRAPIWKKEISETGEEWIGLGP